MYDITTLDNGLRTVTYRMPQMRSVACGIWIATGSRYESKRNSGISHFLEHLLFKGTKKRSAEEIKRSIEGKGGALNGFTSEEITCFLATVLKEDLPFAIDVLSDMILNSSLKKDDIEKERTVILEEIKMYLDLPTHLVHELLHQLLWPDQPLGRFIAGTIETVSQVKQADIIKYKNTSYNPKNMVVAVCGNVTPHEVSSVVKECLAKVAMGTGARFKEARVLQHRPQFHCRSQKTEQTHIAVGAHSLSRFHQDRYALALLNIILGANMSSRLYQKVREEQGLAYDIRSHVRKYYDAGAFTISLGVENSKVLKALGLVLSELRRISRGVVLNDEFHRAREYYTGQLLLALEDTSDHMLWMGEKLLTTGLVPTVDETLAKINEVRKEDIRRVARAIFKNSNLNLAIIGPLSDKDKQKIEKNFHL